MPKYHLFAAAALVGCGIAAGQTAPKLTFEVALIKPAALCCPAGQWPDNKPGEDRINFRYATLKSCVAFAYRLKEYQVSGPAWLAEARFDIQAKGAEGTRREQLPEMMQALLAERLKVVVRREKKEFNVFALVQGKGGAKLKETSAPADVPGGASYVISMTAKGVGRMECKRADMTSLANTLPRFVGRPVVDLTELAGRFDFDLEFSPEDMKGMAVEQPPTGGPGAVAEFGVSIFSSIQRIGLRLDGRKMPLDTIVVDSAERTPIEN